MTDIATKVAQLAQLRQAISDRPGWAIVDGAIARAS